MLCKRLRHRKNAAARPEPDARSRPGVRHRGQHPVELGKVLDRNRAVTSRHGLKRRMKLDVLDRTGERYGAGG